jgi:hypothetical protein
MLLYMDDDSIQGTLVALLRDAGHDVVVPADFRLAGAHDAVHLTKAIVSGRVLMTYNHGDFEELRALLEVAGGRHPGILVVRRDNDKRDMKPSKIVKAVAKFLTSGDPIKDRLVILNQYR